MHCLQVSAVVYCSMLNFKVHSQWVAWEAGASKETAAVQLTVPSVRLLLYQVHILSYTLSVPKHVPGSCSECAQSPLHVDHFQKQGSLQAMFADERQS